MGRSCTCVGRHRDEISVPQHIVDFGEERPRLLPGATAITGIASLVRRVASNGRGADVRNHLEPHGATDHDVWACPNNGRRFPVYVARGEH